MKSIKNDLKKSSFLLTDLMYAWIGLLKCFLKLIDKSSLRATRLPLWKGMLYALAFYALECNYCIKNNDLIIPISHRPLIFNLVV